MTNLPKTPKQLLARRTAGPASWTLLIGAVFFLAGGILPAKTQPPSQPDVAR